MPIKVIADLDSTAATHQATVGVFVAAVEDAGEQILSINISTNRQGMARDYVTQVYYTDQPGTL